MGVYLRCPEGWPSEFQTEPGLWNVGLMGSDGAFAEAPVTGPAPTSDQLRPIAATTPRQSSPALLFGGLALG